MRSAVQRPAWTTSVSRRSQPALQRATCACGRKIEAGGECAACRQRRVARQATALQGSPTVAPPIVHEVVSRSGQPLERSVSADMEGRVGADFSAVRVHDDARAHASAAAVQARAYTVGQHVVFGAGHYRPLSDDGRALLAHELVHTIQQRDAGPLPRSLPVSSAWEQGEVQAHALGEQARNGRAVAAQPARVARLELEAPPPATAPPANVAPATASAPTAAAPPAGGGPVMICAKGLEAPVLGRHANHAFIDATGQGNCRGAGLPGNYAVTDLVSGNFARGCATKTDRSADPRAKTPVGKPCDPKPGVTDLHACLRASFSAYADPSVYSNEAVVVGAGFGGAVRGYRWGRAGAAAGGAIGGPVGAGIGGVLGGALGAYSGALGGARFTSRWNGPNSNTFAATLAGACCADASSSGLGWVPGWEHSPATACSAPAPAPTPSPAPAAGVTPPSGPPPSAPPPPTDVL